MYKALGSITIEYHTVSYIWGTSMIPASAMKGTGCTQPVVLTHHHSMLWGQSLPVLVTISVLCGQVVELGFQCWHAGSPEDSHMLFLHPLRKSQLKGIRGTWCPGARDSASCTGCLQPGFGTGWVDKAGSSSPGTRELI